MKLTPTQLDTLQRLASCDEPLSYFRGGFWTLQSIGEADLDAGRVPSWYVTMGTVKALERMGMLKKTGTANNYAAGYYPALVNRVLSARGLAVATGTDTPALGLVEAVVAYTGHILHYSSFSVLDSHEWNLLIEQEPSLEDGTAAFINDKGDIKIHAGYESDALHELLHAAGLKPDPQDTVFICEGLTQIATEEIAKQLSLRVRRNYKNEVFFIHNYLRPATRMKTRDLISAYIESGLEAIAATIVGPGNDNLYVSLLAELRQISEPTLSPVLASILEQQN